MRRMTLVTTLALVLAATGATAEVTVTSAARTGEAPNVWNLAGMAPVPKAETVEEFEIPILVPDFLSELKPAPDAGPDLAMQAPIAELAPAWDLSLEGYSSDDNVVVVGGRLAPPDTQGDIGLEFYVQWCNLGWLIFDAADGSLVGGPFPGDIFWQGFGGPCELDNAGDPIVLFDHLAEQWIFSQFTSPSRPDGHQCFAVSHGSDPAGPYYLYDFVVSPGGFNDYPKIGVWPDGYYLSTNEFAPSFAGVHATAFERDRMLVGDPAAQMIQFNLPYTGAAPVRFSLQPAHLEGSDLPPEGTCNTYVQSFDDETWGTGAGPDGYQFWNFCVDWDTPGNSTFTQGPFVPTTEFDANLCGYGPCVPQPGTTQRLDTLAQFTMYRFANRYFPGLGLRGVISHTVDAGVNLASSRWAAFDGVGTPLTSILDTGTLDASDELHRWMPSVAMDKVGNLAVVYSRSGNAAPDYPSVFYTGRETTDPPGTMQAEVSCIDGTGTQRNTSRWGDYATVSVDPEDECTFWVTNEYVETTGSFQWNTRICSFKFESCIWCGNGVQEDPEECDGDDLGGETCVSLGFLGGTLACSDDCTFDTSGCYDCWGGKTEGTWNLPTPYQIGQVFGELRDQDDQYFGNLVAGLTPTGPQGGIISGMIYDRADPDPDYWIDGEWVYSPLQPAIPPWYGTFSARIYRYGTNVAVGLIEGKFSDDPNFAVIGAYSGKWEICP